MKTDIVALPKLLRPEHLTGRAVVVIDTLRATTTIAAALAAGAREVRVFLTVEDARAAAEAFDGPRALAGERKCVRIPGFDLGNSPGEMTPASVGGRTLFMTTTNGTVAIHAAAGAAEVLTAAFVNRAATVAHLRALGRDVTFLCAGTDGEPAPEDEAAARTMRALLQGDDQLDPRQVRAEFAQVPGGRNIIAAGLEEDLDDAARVDALSVVCRVEGTSTVRRL